jgi:orotate phosphoribosyltransferase
MNLFNYGSFQLHSGDTSHWKIDCDALSDEDWETLAFMIQSEIKFGSVIGIPKGGIKLAAALEKYRTNGYPTLIVDDVLTTGKSMNNLKTQNPDAVGVVVFARDKCPKWITPIFQYSLEGN